MGVNLRIVSIATIYIETILFCQALGGWPAIEWILRNSLHYYDDKCTSLGLEVPCDVQDKAYVRLYSLTYSALKIVTFRVFNCENTKNFHDFQRASR